MNNSIAGANKKLAVATVAKGIILNIVLSTIKMIAGILGHSTALISDAIDSASDIVSNIIVMAGIKISAKASDSEHQYGHERLECIATIIMAAILAAVGLAIGFAAFSKVMSALSGQMPKPPELLSAAAAAISIFAKEIMYRYSKAIALKINSGALMADALHHRSDAFSSIGSMAAVVGSHLGLPVLDPLAGVIICFTIIKNAYDVFKEAVDQLVDHSCDEDTMRKMRQCIEAQAGVAHLDRLQTRIFGSRVFVDVEVSADDNLTLLESHRIAENIHRAIEDGFPAVKHCMVHINPVSESQHDY